MYINNIIESIADPSILSISASIWSHCL